MNRLLWDGKGRGIRKGIGMGKWTVFALIAGVLLAPAMRADDPGTGVRAVRLSSVDGKVQVSNGGQVLQEDAVANTPLVEGTRVTTGDDGRAEIQFEDGSIARISPNSSLTLTVLRGVGASGEAEITLDAGLGYFELQGGGQTAGAIRVRFADSVVTASGFTVMRIDMDNPPGSLAVFSGNAHLDRSSGAVAVDLHGGESVALSGTDLTHYTLNETIEPDSWDAWNSDRDQALSAEAADKTAATSGLGQSSNPAWNDLDANGSWYNVPGDGNVWSPYDASDPGFDPYGNGYWANTPGYGYSWVSAYGWGYLPYQCGLWNWYDGFGWGWAPGLGGCNTLFIGYPYGYGVNIGRGWGGYHPPLRPRPPMRGMGGRGMIPVSRHISAPVTTLPVRDRNSTVTIAGHPVQPFHQITSRPVYARGTTVYGNGTVVTHVGEVPPSGQGRVGGAIFYGGKPPAATGTTARGPAPKSGPAPRASSGGSYHAPSGGGGGGHVSSGGGGGGGAHVGGGGGGSHH